jgi:hypothetical protein
VSVLAACCVAKKCSRYFGIAKGYFAIDIAA